MVYEPLVVACARPQYKLNQHTRLHSVAWVHKKGLDQGPRLQCVELFAGVARITQAFKDAGFPAQELEISRRPVSDNLLTCAGWFRAISMVVRVDPGGLVWCGTPCSSWARGVACQGLQVTALCMCLQVFLRTLL
jgi:hypothetical protein